MTASEKLEQLLRSKVSSDEEYEENCSDIENEFREGEFETDIPAPYSRNYESKSVGCKALDGSYIGWTYYFGGGKHSNPEEIDWVSDAYDLELVSEKKVITIVREWKKSGV